jgi:hypothetical protein
LQYNIIVTTPAGDAISMLRTEAQTTMKDTPSMFQLTENDILFGWRK